MGASLQAIITNLGIQAGTPFNVNKYTLVGAAVPPTIISGRLGQLLDVQQSIVAPGLSGALNTFILGSGTSEGVNQGDTIFIGQQITGAGGAATNKQIIIGVRVTQLAAFETVDNTILIGVDPTFGAATGVFGNSVYLGNQLNLTLAGGATDFVGSVMIGNGGRIRGGNAVLVGASGDVSSEAAIVGHTAVGGVQSAGIGKGINLDSNSFGGGRRARTGPEGVSIGFFADTLGKDSAGAFGRDALPNFDYSWAFGRGSVTFETNAYGFGTGPSPYYMTVLRLGPNTEAGYPGLSVFLPSAAAGNNVAAPNTTFRGGISTGNSITGGRIRFQTGIQGASGGTYQTLQNVLELVPSIGTAADCCGVSLPVAVDAAGAGLGTLTTAPHAGDPDFWVVLKIAGVNRALPCWDI